MWIALQRPAVQQFVADKVTQSLARRLQTPFTIKRIEVKFFNRAVLEGIYIEDLQGDTLLYAGRLEARLNVFAPFRQELEVRSIHLDNAVANLARGPDSLYNFQFIIDAFSSAEPDTTREPSPWAFDIKKVAVAKTRFSLEDAISQSSLYVRIGDFSSEVRKLGLEEQRIDFGRIRLRNSYGAYSSRGGQSAVTPPPDTASAMEFPFPGWVFTAGQLEAEKVDFSYDDFSRPPGPRGQFDPYHIQAEGILAHLGPFSWVDTALELTVQQLALREMNGFELRKLAGEMRMSPREISLSKLELETPGSRMPPSSASLLFPEFASLGRFIDEVEMDVGLSPSYFAVEDIRYWSGPVPYIDTTYTGKARLSGRLQGKVGNLSASRLYAALDDALHLQLSGRVQGLPRAEALRFGLNIVELQASYNGLSRATEGLALPEGLSNMGAVRLKGFVNGQADSLFTHGLEIRTDGYTSFVGKATAVGLPDMDKARFLLDIHELRTQPSELAGFLEGGLPQPLSALGKMQYRGRFEGTAHDFTLAGKLDSEQGQLEEDFTVHFNEAYSNARYQGNASLTSLELGAILGDTSLLGAATMNLEATGSGLSVDSLNARINATVRSITLSDYEYQDIRVDGKFEKRQFEGKVNVDDPHLCFQFDGRADFNDSIPDFDFTFRLDTAELAYLNLYPSALRLSTTIVARLRGNTLDNLSGAAAMRRLAVADEKYKYFADSIILEAFERSPGFRVVDFQSDIAKARLEGNYRIGELPGLLTEFVDGFFPIKRLIQPDSLADSLLVAPQLASQDFRFSASLSRPVRLSRIFLPELQELDTASFQGRFNSEKRQLDFSGGTPGLQYNGLQIDSLQLSVQGSPAGLNNKLSLQGIQNEGQALLAYSEATARMFRDSLTFALNIQDDTAGQRLGLQGMVVAPVEKFHLKLFGPMILNGYEWAIPEDNDIAFAPGSLNVENLRFARNRQEFRIQSRDKAADEGFAPIDISFEHFRLVELSRLVGLDENFLSGALNGQVVVSRPDTSFRYEANLEVRQLMIDSQEVGELALYAAPSANREELILNAQLSGRKNAFSLTGRYGLANSQLGFGLKVDKLQMALADIFAGGAVSNSRGRVSGQLDIGGTVDQPEIVGAIHLDSVSAFVEYLQARYLVPSHTLRLRETSIDIGRMELLDPSNREATLEGQITHKHFGDIQLGLQFSAPSFQVLNTGPEDNDLFYGSVMASIDARVNGPLEAPNIDVYTRTLPGTRVTALPLSEEEAIAQEEFILYGTPTQYQSDTGQVAVYQTDVLGYELSLQLELTPDAELIAIIDPATGDKLNARGRANLLVEMSRNGQLSTTGDIYITEGSYFFNYEGLVKRTFQIQSGSHIFLPGDPLDARFDITAQYRARTSTYELISQQAGLNPEEARAAKRRTDVLVIMNLEGTLSEPEITFDIRLPEAQASAVANAVENKLAQLRESGNDLNKQVFGLLLFNSFIAEQSGSTSLAQAGENIALSSVSNLVTNQLNRLANQYIKGVDLQVRLESYRTDTPEGAASTVTDVGLDLSKQLFNDRLSIKVGGSVGVEGPSGQEEFTTLASEFLLEYKLTEDGRYRVRVFRRPDYDIIKASNTVRTGASILYKKSFGGVQPNSDATKTKRQ